MEKYLSFGDIISAVQLKEQRYEVKEWGGFVVIREMTAEARDQYEQSLFTQNQNGDIERNMANARAKMIAACVVGSDGKRMFDTDKKIEALGNQPITIIDPLFDACRKLNAVSEEDIEELTGN